MPLPLFSSCLNYMVLARPLPLLSSCLNYKVLARPLPLLPSCLTCKVLARHIPLLPSCLNYKVLARSIPPLPSCRPWDWYPRPSDAKIPPPSCNIDIFGFICMEYATWYDLCASEYHSLHTCIMKNTENHSQRWAQAFALFKKAFRASSSKYEWVNTV